MMDSPRLLWQPRPEDVKESNLYRYQHYICKEYNIELNSYDDLWIWSNEHADLFWSSLFKYFELVYEGDIEPAYTGDVMPDITWFDNIRLNLAENLTRYSKEDKLH
jgi:acetoacetyl-CoA synthetase